MASGGQNTRHYAPFPLRGYKLELSSSNRKPAQRIHRRGVTQYVRRTLGVQTKVVKQLRDRSLTKSDALTILSPRFSKLHKDDALEAGTTLVLAAEQADILGQTLVQKVRTPAAMIASTPRSVEVGFCNHSSRAVWLKDEQPVRDLRERLAECEAQLGEAKEKIAELQKVNSEGRGDLLVDQTQNMLAGTHYLQMGSNTLCLVLTERYDPEDPCIHIVIVIIIIDCDGDTIIETDMLCLVSKAKRVQSTEGRELMFLVIPAGTKVKDIGRCGQLCVKITEDITSRKRTLQLEMEDALEACESAIKVELNNSDKRPTSTFFFAPTFFAPTFPLTHLPLDRHHPPPPPSPTTSEITMDELVASNVLDRRNTAHVVNRPATALSTGRAL
eukprot:COSAG01_NODE_7524_length_3166_cov_17.631888_1_plen_386_part_00